MKITTATSRLAACSPSGLGKARSARCAALALMAMALSTVGACTQYADDQPRPAGALTTLEGTIVIGGLWRISPVTLVCSDGDRYTIESSPLADELIQLSGMSVSLEGWVQDGKVYGQPLFTLRTYQLLPLRLGEQMFIGVFSEVRTATRSGDVIVSHYLYWEHQRYALEGEIEVVDGAKIWVAGSWQHSVFGLSLSTILVREYGIIRQPRSSIWIGDSVVEKLSD